ncbi:MAG: ABC transporter ATP-binding protein [Actinomycetota bacterium]|nr:ABC transporter ATP-binding protein [Actinomycetota bacterium]
MALLEMRDVHVTYRSQEGPIPAVRGVNLTLDPGQILGVAGESGCGKSTLASTVLRLFPADATVTGEVLVDGDNVLTMKWGQVRAARWAKASIVFQGALHSLNPIQRIDKQLMEPILLHEKDVNENAARKRVVELLEQVGLPGRLADAYPHQMSGGQKQRVMIALALACRPQVLIADEPTTALDVMVQAQVLDLLSSIARDHGLALMIISHDLSVLATTCDEVLVMYAGKVVEAGPAAEVFEHPKHPYTRALSGAFPTIGDMTSRFAPSGLPGDPPLPGELVSGCPFRPRCPEAEDRCAEAEPDLRPATDEQFAACIHIGEAVST